MPKELHDKLTKEARKKGLTGKDRDAYIYSTLKKVEGGMNPMMSRKEMMSEKEMKAMMKKKKMMKGV